MAQKKLALAFAVLSFAFIACSDGNTITYANKTYKTVKIGEQVWFAENLNYDAEGSKCYDNNPDNCTKYGRLYNWKMAMTICPDGWRLPSNEDWDKLLRFAYDNTDAKNPYYSPTAGKFLKAASGWDNHKGKGNGTDDFGFSALPGGACNSDSNSDCDFIGYRGLWWSATEGSVGYYAYYRNLEYYGPYNTADSISRLFSVRCLQD
ncbi:MAG: hypothetical protein LBQ76_04245 [Candidatus Fibromonas sp.]|jgi:uncharacterized protein (TIGR02145 family)|nr:hypothetical protein [Candidatus Fibromonas sp.]